MHDVYVGVVDQVHEVVVAGHLSESCLFCHSFAPVETGLVNIANRYQTIGHVEVMAAADTAEADDTLGQLIAGSDVTLAAEHVARQDGKRSRGRCAF